MSKRHTRKKIVGFLEKHEIAWYFWAFIFMVLSAPAAFLALPDTATATFIVVTIAGILNGLATLTTAIIASNQDQKDPKDEVDPDSNA